MIFQFQVREDGLGGGGELDAIFYMRYQNGMWKNTSVMDLETLIVFLCALLVVLCEFIVYGVYSSCFGTCFQLFIPSIVVLNLILYVSN